MLSWLHGVTFNTSLINHEIVAALVNTIDISYSTRSRKKKILSRTQTIRRLIIKKKRGKNHTWLDKSLHFLPLSHGLIFSQIDRNIANRDFTYQTMISSSRRAHTHTQRGSNVSLLRPHFVFLLSSRFIFPVALRNVRHLGLHTSPKVVRLNPRRGLPRYEKRISHLAKYSLAQTLTV